MTLGEEMRQSQNRALAAKLVGVLSFEVGYGELAATRDYVWDSFIDFYTRLDKHNCPKQQETAKDPYGNPYPKIAWTKETAFTVGNPQPMKPVEEFYGLDK